MQSKMQFFATHCGDLGIRIHARSLVHISKNAKTLFGSPFLTQVLAFSLVRYCWFADVASQILANNFQLESFSMILDVSPTLTSQTCKTGTENYAKSYFHLQYLGFPLEFWGILANKHLELLADDFSVGNSSLLVKFTRVIANTSSFSPTKSADVSVDSFLFENRKELFLHF